MKPWAWIALFALVGFSLSAGFSAELGLPRDMVVLAYLVAGGGLLLGLLHSNGDILGRSLRRNWPAGVLVGVGIGALLAVTVIKQPGSSSPQGVHLTWALVWLGLVYGLLDALLLNVLPALVLERSSTSRSSRWARSRFAATALVASMFVTGVYHLGYREFRGVQLAQPLIGNAVLTAGYLLTGNLAAPLLGHVIMHGAAVLHGMETSVQLPPHYPGSSLRPRGLSGSDQVR